jgi:predicted DNA-binding transcriptional regulator AlpA
MEARAAARLAGAAAERAGALGPRILYKKIGSTLRGHVGAELAATLEARRRGGAERPLVLLAPAFPAAGRTTRGGVVLVNGAPLEETELWRDAGRAGPAHLSSLLAGAGLRAVLVGLEKIRGGGLARALERAAEKGMDVAACDAETEGDLGAIAAAGARLGSRVVWAGSGGLARHLPAALGLQGTHRAARLEVGHDPRPVLALVGSRSEVSRAQARALASAAGVVALALDPEALLAGEGDPRFGPPRRSRRRSPPGAICCSRSRTVRFRRSAGPPSRRPWRGSSRRTSGDAQARWRRAETSRARSPAPPVRGVPTFCQPTDLCRRLKISRATSYRLESDGFLPRPVRIGPSTIRWSVAELEKFERRLLEDRAATGSNGPLNLTN